MLITASSQAQVNIENQRLGSNTTGLAGSADLTFKIERGNSELTQIGLTPRAAYRTGRHLVFTLNRLSFIDAAAGSIVNAGFSHLRYNYSMSAKVTFEAFTQIQYDRSQDLSRRSLVGAGLRFPIVGADRFDLAVGTAAMYEYEKLRTGSVHETARNSSYISLHLLSKSGINIGNTVYIQPAFENPDDIRILDQGEIKFVLADWLALTTTASYRYDSQPPDGVKEYDLSIENGISVSF